LPTTEGIETGARAAPVPSALEFVSARERERPVFVTDTDRRARLVLGVGGGLATVAVLWCAALLAGAFGLRGLPAVPLPQVGGGDEAPAPGAGLREEDRSGRAPDPDRRDGDTQQIHRRDRKQAGARIRGSGAPGLSGPRLRPERELGGPTPPSPLPQQAPSERTAPASRPAPIPAQPPQRAAPAAPPRTEPYGTGAGENAPNTRHHPTYTPSGKAVPAGQDKPSPAEPPSALPDQAVDRRASAR
jgi:hypothetical protein